jgi:nicotinamidase-related amidase
MTSAPVRDQLADHLITPENAAFLFIDYQPSQLAGVRSMDRALLVKNAVSTVRTIKTFGVPVLHSTINVASGQGPTLPELAQSRATAKAGRNQHIHGCPWKIGSAVLRSRESP